MKRFDKKVYKEVENEYQTQQNPKTINPPTINHNNTKITQKPITKTEHLLSIINH